MFGTLVPYTLTDGTAFTATEYLEDISLDDVDGDTAPYFRSLTVAATEEVQGSTQHVHTLLGTDDTRAALGDGVRIMLVQLGFAYTVLLDGVEECEITFEVVD